MAAESREPALTLPFDRASDTNWLTARQHHMWVTATPTGD
jgi:hypothetical protein